MNRPVLFITAGLAAVAVVTVLLLRPSDAPVNEPVAQPAESSTTPASPVVEPGVTATPDAGASRPARRAPTAATGAAEAPPAPEVEAPPPAADVATLRIDSDVPGAQVFIDRQFIGAAPVTAENVRPGSHQLNVSAEGFEGIAQTIDVAPGPRDITVRFREVRLNTRLAVVHKHRIGSCKGELVATAQGLRYETTDKDDAFTAALTDLETFQVEYLDKTLRVKLRRGKQFNFTDPEANADRLFVFHRDVDKARAQLGQGFAAAQ